MKEKVVVLDRGNVEFLYPETWKLSGTKEGYLTLTDPTESVRLEVSYLKLPPAAEGIPVETLLTRLLTQVPEAGARPKIESREEPNRRYAWCDYAYPSTDKRSGDPAEAHGRWMLGSNGLFQLLMTYYYWTDDAPWAVPAWERILETVQLGDGSQLDGPEAHWSMRRKN